MAYVDINLILKLSSIVNVIKQLTNSTKNPSVYGMKKKNREPGWKTLGPIAPNDLLIKNSFSAYYLQNLLS